MRLGVDLGGTKIAAAVLDDQGQVVWEQRVATPRHDYDATLRSIQALVDSGERASGTACTVGIGIPGAVSPATGLVKNANSTWLIGRPLQADLEQMLHRSVRLANDANCLAMSEATDGAGASARVVFGVILGTGTGGGIAVDGRVVTGANAIAGEWGHNSLPWPDEDERPGPSCYCGRRGCIETFLSGPALAADYRRRGGGEASGEVIVQRAGEGEPLAGLTIRVWTTRLAKALASVVNVLDPDVIVVGGGLSRIVSLYADLPAQWGAWVFSDDVRTPIVPAKYGDASGVRGAAWLWDKPVLLSS
ncbi:MAG: ROK family protein [Acidobacteriota bacterium]